MRFGRSMEAGQGGTWAGIAYGPALAPIAIATAIMAAGASAYGQIEQGQAQSEAAKYQAQVASNNAIAAGNNANAATQAGLSDAAARQLQAGQQQGAIKAAEASGGVDVNSGSALNTQISQKLVAKADVDQALNRSRWAAYGYRTQQAGFQAQSGLDSAMSSQYSTAGAIGAGGALLAGASSAIGGYFKNLPNTPTGLSAN